MILSSLITATAIPGTSKVFRVRFTRESIRAGEMGCARIEKRLKENKKLRRIILFIN
jgi:hypothetical protein